MNFSHVAKRRSKLAGCVSAGINHEKFGESCRDVRWKNIQPSLTRLRIFFARLPARKFKPSKEFRALKDYIPIKQVADDILNEQIMAALPKLDVGQSERVVFYPVGAAEGLLLDRANPKWQKQYLTEKFFVEKYFDKRGK